MNLQKISGVMAKMSKRYSKLLLEHAEGQNMVDLVLFLENDEITKEEYEFLKEYNKQTHELLKNKMINDSGRGKA